MNKSEAMRLAGGMAFKGDKGLPERLRAAYKRKYFQELVESWDLWYDLYFFNDPPGMTQAEYEALTRREAERLLPFLARDSSFLDLGCGDGRILKRVSPHCGQAHGADISARAIAHARRNCRGLGNIRLHRLTRWELGFRAAAFDLVLCHLMLSHMDVEPVISCLREIHRVLKPGGRLVFDLPNLSHEDHLAYLLSPDRSNWPGINRPRFWTAEMVREFLPRCGFRIDELIPGLFLEVRAAKI